MLSVAISTRRVQSLSLRSLMDCVALPVHVAAGVTWWREGPWCWSGNSLANGTSTCSQPDDIDCSGRSRAPYCGDPAGDASRSDAGCSRGLPHSEGPGSDSPPDRTPSCLTENRSHPASGPANTVGQALQPLGADGVATRQSLTGLLQLVSPCSRNPPPYSQRLVIVESVP